MDAEDGGQFAPGSQRGTPSICGALGRRRIRSAGALAGILLSRNGGALAPTYLSPLGQSLKLAAQVAAVHHHPGDGLAVSPPQPLSFPGLNLLHVQHRSRPLDDCQLSVETWTTSFRLHSVTAGRC